MNKVLVYLFVNRSRIVLALSISLVGVVLLFQIRFEGPIGLFGTKYDRFSSNFKDIKFVKSRDAIPVVSDKAIPGIVKYMHGFAWDVLANEHE